jgi:hypothetical protein
MADRRLRRQVLTAGAPEPRPGRRPWKCADRRVPVPHPRAVRALEPGWKQGEEPHKDHETGRSSPVRPPEPAAARWLPRSRWPSPSSPSTASTPPSPSRPSARWPQARSPQSGSGESGTWWPRKPPRRSPPPSWNSRSTPTTARPKFPPSRAARRPGRLASRPVMLRLVMATPDPQAAVRRCRSGHGRSRAGVRRPDAPDRGLPSVRAGRGRGPAPEGRRPDPPGRCPAADGTSYPTRDPVLEAGRAWHRRQRCRVGPHPAGWCRPPGRGQ